MPELPEVETTRRGIEPYILYVPIDRILVRDARLRWPVPDTLSAQLEDREFKAVNRRGKYLLLQTDSGTLIVHLGMSGSLRITDESSPFRKHDHVEFAFRNRCCLRFHDPRRFGCIIWTTQNPEEHALLASMGPEPFSGHFNGTYLYERAKNRRTAIKSFLMDSHIVVGVGNIYANEALFLSGIDPRRSAGRVSMSRMNDLSMAVAAVLNRSILQGGTTLRDFVNENGQPGYFQLTLNVYDKTGHPCPRCGSPIRQCRIAQRSSFFCAHCQH
jgi:formamidopyrimidine-DNA glycosylase